MTKKIPVRNVCERKRNITMEKTGILRSDILTKHPEQVLVRRYQNYIKFLFVVEFLPAYLAKSQLD